MDLISPSWAYSVLGWPYALPSDFWSGTGGALISGILTAVIAVGSALLAAYLARRNDRDRESAAAAGRVAAVVVDVSHVITGYNDPSYVPKVGRAIGTLLRALVLDAAHIGDRTLNAKLWEITNWLSGPWIERMDQVQLSLPDQIHRLEDAPELETLLNEAHNVLGDTLEAIHTWQLEHKLTEFGPPPAGALESPGDTDRSEVPLSSGGQA